MNCSDALSRCRCAVSARLSAAQRVRWAPLSRAAGARRARRLVRQRARRTLQCRCAWRLTSSSRRLTALRRRPRTRAWRTVPPEKRALLVKHAPKAASAAAGGAVVGYGVSFLARRRQRRLQRQLDALDAEKGELEKRLASANEQAELLRAQGASSGFQEAAAMSKSVAEATAAAKRAASAAAQAATACNRGPPACARSASSLNAVATPASSHGGAGAGPIQPPLAHPSVLPP